MEHLPYYISTIFISTTLLTLLIFYYATNFSKPLIAGILIWLALQALLSLRGFYTVTSGTPPRFSLLLVPPLVFITIVFSIKSTRRIIDGFNVSLLTLLHIVRIPVELTLYWLFLYKTIPQVMTFEGRNFDILCGLTAPLIYYFGYVKAIIGKKTLLAWNIFCLLLLFNIITTAVLSAPFSFQRLAFSQPSIALFYFPFIWLPCCVVPIVLFAHLATIRNLLKVKQVTM